VEDYVRGINMKAVAFIIWSLLCFAWGVYCATHKPQENKVDEV